jgi:hypothetical protein
MVFSYIETIKFGCGTNVPALPDSVHFHRQLEPPNRPPVEIVIQTERTMSRISDNVAPRHYHPDHAWSAGVELELKRWEVINSTDEALRALTELWPPKRQNGVQEAIEICKANLAGSRTTHECKRALLRAALKSNVEVNRLWVRAL